MNKTLAQKLCELNNDFYRSQAASFSRTRRAKWLGWERCLAEMGSFSEYETLSVLDVACGNLRFEEFLAAALPSVNVKAIGLDTCDDLVPSLCTGVEVNKVFDFSRELQDHSCYEITYVHCDVMQKLSKMQLVSDITTLTNSVDLSVSFGFMHHIPLPEWREILLQNLIDITVTGGFVMVSFWRFMDNESMAQKAQATHEQALEYLSNQRLLNTQDLAGFNEGDYLIGWRNTPGVYRYCHSFSDEEIDNLLAGVSDSAECVARFRADGRSGNLNEYLVLRVC